MLREFLKTTFVYQPLLKERINWLLELYGSLIQYFVFRIIILIIMMYLYLRFIKKGGEILHTIQEDGRKIYYGFFKSLWLIIKTKFSFLKYMLIGGMIVGCAWFIVSFFFGALSAMPFEPTIKTTEEYTNFIAEVGVNELFLSTDYIQQHLGAMYYLLSNFALYALGCIIIGGYFITFCFGNKCLRNMGIVFCALVFFIMIFGPLLQAFINIFNP